VIADALRVLLFGMLGIFLVMAIIYAVIVALAKISARSSQRAAAEVIPVTPAVSETEPLASTEGTAEEPITFSAGDALGVDTETSAPLEYAEDDVVYLLEGEYLGEDGLIYSDNVVYVEQPVYEDVEV